MPDNALATDLGLMLVCALIAAGAVRLGRWEARHWLGDDSRLETLGTCAPAAVIAALGWCLIHLVLPQVIPAFWLSPDFLPHPHLSAPLVGPTLWACLIGILAAASWIDLRVHLLPDSLTALAGLTALACQLTGHPAAVPLGAEALVVATLLAAPRLLAHLPAAAGAESRSGRLLDRVQAAFGSGDIALLAAFCLLVGPLGIVLQVFLASLLMLPVIAIGLATGRTSRRSRLPFGPALSIGGLLVLAMGPHGVLGLLGFKV